MLDVLRAKRPAGIEFVEADMRSFDLGAQRFALIYSAFRAFQHLTEVEDQLRCLARVRAHLAPGGRFAFDVFKPDLARMAQDEEPETEDLRFEHEGDEVVRTARVVRDGATQCMRVVFRYERRRRGRPVGSESAEFVMRWFYRYELEHGAAGLLRQCAIEVHVGSQTRQRGVGRVVVAGGDRSVVEVAHPNRSTGFTGSVGHAARQGRSGYGAAGGAPLPRIAERGGSP
jgi:SAM-dependent methyltransferase